MCGKITTSRMGIIGKRRVSVFSLELSILKRACEKNVRKNRPDESRRQPLPAVTPVPSRLSPKAPC
jgi:hypothetical protein